MKQLAMEGKRRFLLGSVNVTLKVGRIVNNRQSGVSKPLSIRLWALESPSGDSLKGHVVAEIELQPMPAGSEKIGFEATVPALPIPNGYFYPALTLSEQNDNSPVGWFIFDIFRLGDPVYFGKRVSLGDSSVRSVSTSIIEVNIHEIRNETPEPTGALRVTLLLSKEPYDEGPIRGFKLGEEQLEGLSGGKAHQRLIWRFDRPENTSENQYAVLFLEEQVQDKWIVRDQYSSSISLITDDSELVSDTIDYGDPMKELDALVGLDEVKKELRELDAWEWRQRQIKEHGFETKPRSIHMCFSGSPGTGKTTVARIAGRFLAKNGILQSGHFKEVGRVDLVAEYLGQTAHNTKEAIQEALGGVLFIDEAYALSDPTASGSGQDYGREAINTLITAMENYREDLCVIVAGYTAEMERFLSVNPGIRSRIGRTIVFPDFSDQELLEIFERMIADGQLTCEPDVKPEFMAYMRRLKASMSSEQFGNARSVRNVIERATQKLAVRVRELNIPNPSLDDLFSLKLSDFSFFSDKADNPEVFDDDIVRNLLQKLQERFENEVARKNIEPERVNAMRSAIDEFSRRGIGAETGRRTGFGTIDQLKSEITELTSQIGIMRGITHEQLENTKNPSYGLPQPPSGSRAEYVRELFWPLRRSVSEVSLAGGLQSADNSEVLELAKQTSELDKNLHVIGDNDEGVLVFEEARLRTAAERVRTLTARKHLLVANPIWGDPKLGWSANAVYFAGHPEVRDLLSKSCAKIRMRITTPQSALDAAASNFAQLVQANVCVFDLATAAGCEQATVAYSLGIAWVLGKPIVILTEPGVDLPFDINLPAVMLSNGDAERKEALAEAVERACYQVHSSAPTATVDTLIDEVEARYSHLRQNEVIDQSLTMLKSHRTAPDWLMVAAMTRQLIRFSGKEGPPLLLHPRYPVEFRESEEKRLFHVMPFSYRWSNDIMETANAACAQNANYIRGDRVVDPKIINSIWDEICRASHVLVDLTEFNSNVALELGIVHCMGKITMVTGQEGTERQLFDEVAKLRIQPYSLKDLPALGQAISNFVSKKR